MTLSTSCNTQCTAMAIRDGHIDEEELVRRGDDSPPLMASVPEPPPSHWGRLTSQSRTLSPAYVEFLRRNQEDRNERR
jgi:hypothetical protein